MMCPSISHRRERWVEQRASAPNLASWSEGQVSSGPHAPATVAGAIGRSRGCAGQRRPARKLGPQAPVAQWIERSPPEREVACSNHAGRASPVSPERASCSRSRRWPFRRSLATSLAITLPPTTAASFAPLAASAALAPAAAANTYLACERQHSSAMFKAELRIRPYNCLALGGNGLVLTP